ERVRRDDDAHARPVPPWPKFSPMSRLGVPFRRQMKKAPWRREKSGQEFDNFTRLENKPGDAVALPDDLDVFFFRTLFGVQLGKLDFLRLCRAHHSDLLRRVLVQHPRRAVHGVDNDSYARRGARMPNRFCRNYNEWAPDVKAKPRTDSVKPTGVGSTSRPSPVRPSSPVPRDGSRCGAAVKGRLRPSPLDGVPPHRLLDA